MQVKGGPVDGPIRKVQSSPPFAQGNQNARVRPDEGGREPG